MFDDRNLIPGAFYWVIPAHDPDTDLVWQNKEQPARFEGYDNNGNDRWFWLGVYGEYGNGLSDWPAIWVGKEIKSDV
jgi:hypothetical protein